MEVLSYSSKFLLFLVTLISITSQINSTLAILHTSPGPAATTEFIKTSCKVTIYPELCYNSLFTHVNAIQTSPKSLANAALSVTLATTRTTSAMVLRMSKMPGIIHPREGAALMDCLEVLGDAVDELQKSITELAQIRSSKSFGLKNDIQTWVSAALTNEDTCMEGFGGKDMDGKLKTVVRGKIVNICHLTSNALALIDRFASLSG